MPQSEARLVWQGQKRRGGPTLRVVAEPDPEGDGFEIVTCERLTHDALGGERWVEESGNSWQAAKGGRDAAE